jgi:hypothetical protein
MNIEIINILDRSGSMNELRNDIIGGYNAFLTDQKALPGKARITLVQFNHEIEMLYEAVPIQHIGHLTLGSYIPGGSTYLYDTIVQVLAEQGARIGGETWADKVLVNIITDGKDAKSVKFTKADALQAISHKQDKMGWTFVYQAADPEAFEEGITMGINPAFTSVVGATSAGMAEAYGNMNTMATTLRTGGSAFDAAFTSNTAAKGNKAA